MNKYQEALGNLYKLRSETYNVYQKHNEWDKEIEKYDAVGKNLGILQELVDKEKPMKVDKIDWTPKVIYRCVKCGKK